MSDTESLVSRDSFQGPTVGDVVEEEIEPPFFEFRTSEAFQCAFVSLDAIDIEEDFQRRAIVMRSPPKFLEGAYVSVLRVAMEEIQRGRSMMRQRGHVVGSCS